MPERDGHLVGGGEEKKPILKFKNTIGRLNNISFFFFLWKNWFRRNAEFN